MAKDPFELSFAQEMYVIGLLTSLDAGSKYLTYRESQQPIIPAIRKFLYYLSGTSMLGCFCRESVYSPIEILARSTDPRTDVYEIETDEFDSVYKCHACIALKLGNDILRHEEIDVDLLFQYNVHLFKNIKGCGKCVDRTRTGCLVCQLEQAIKKARDCTDGMNYPIVLDTKMFNSEAVYNSFTMLPSPKNFIVVQDFTYYQEKI